MPTSADNGTFRLATDAIRRGIASLRPVELGQRHLTDQFVVDLHHDTRGAPLGLDRPLQRNHRQLDQIGSRTLHRRVDRLTFSAAFARTAATGDFGQVDSAPEHGFDITLGARRGAGFVHVALDPGKALEIAIDVGRCGAALDAQALGEAESAHAVDQAEIDRLGITPLLGGDRLRRHRKNLAGGGAMNIHALFERTQQAGILADVRHDAQLDLRIIGTDDAVPGRRDEGLANAAPFDGTDRDVLQIGVVAGQPSGHRNRLGIGRVDPAGCRVHHQRQFIGVSALQLGQRTVLEQPGRQRIVGGQFGQHLLVGRRRAGGGFLLHGQAELLEQHIADLLGRAHVEGLAGQRIGLLLELDHAFAELLALRGQRLRIDQHALALDSLQDHAPLASRYRRYRSRSAGVASAAATVPGAHAGTSRCLRTNIRLARSISTCPNGICCAPLPHKSS